MENYILVLLSAVQAIIIAMLILYFLKLRKNNVENNDISNHPDLIRSTADVKSLEDKEKMYIETIKNLKEEKKTQLDLITDVNSYKEISEKSISNYKEVVNDYREFHNKLIGDFKFQGNYNEKKLKDLLLKSGISEGKGGFQKAKGEKNFNSDGDVKTQIPDYIISLPNEQKVVADCKVSLSNFKSYCNEKDKITRAKYLKAHIQSVRKHIQDLSKKDYTRIHSIKNNAFKYVICFMPFDQVYLSVLEHDEDILDFCIKNKILLAGPLTMLAILNNIQESKNQIKQVEEVDKIIKIAEEVLDKYSNIKMNVKNAISSYGTHQKSLRNLIKQVFGSPQSLESKLKKLKNHGVSGKEIPKISDEETQIKDLEDPEENKIIKLPKS